jgi:hypothetical protein
LTTSAIDEASGEEQRKASRYDFDRHAPQYRSQFESVTAADYRVDPAGTVHYPTIGVIQGMQHVAATFTPGERRGPGLAETIEATPRLADEQGLAAPVTSRQ